MSDIEEQATQYDELRAYEAIPHCTDCIWHSLYEKRVGPFYALRDISEHRCSKGFFDAVTGSMLHNGPAAKMREIGACGLAGKLFSKKPFGGLLGQGSI